MSLPILIVFENHWDKIPKLFLQRELPRLAEKGYDTLCMGVPQNITFKELIAKSEHSIKMNSELYSQAKTLLREKGITTELSEMPFDKLSKLMRSYVSSKQYFKAAETVKDLPGKQLIRGILGEAAKLSMQVSGVDIDAEDFDKMISPDLSKRMQKIEANKDYRISVIFKNLLNLKKERDGVIFLCGAGLAGNLLTKFAEKNMRYDVVHCFPCSPAMYPDLVRDLPASLVKTLSRRMYPLTEDGIPTFSQKIDDEIAGKTRYVKEIPEGTANSKFLSNLFGITFKVFMRPGYYVDALVDVESPKIEAIKKGVYTVGLRSHIITLEKTRYFVISAINTRAAAEKIQKLA